MIRGLQCTLSVEYSSNSKIFIMPANNIPYTWINNNVTWVSNYQTQLVYLLIAKGQSDHNEEKILPVLSDVKPMRLHPQNRQSNRFNHDRRGNQDWQRRPTQNNDRNIYQTYNQNMSVAGPQGNTEHSENVVSKVSQMFYDEGRPNFLKQKENRQPYPMRDSNGRLYQSQVNPTIGLLDQVKTIRNYRNDQYLGKRNQEDQELMIRQTDGNIDADYYNQDGHNQMGKNKNQFKQLCSDLTLQTSSINNQQSYSSVFPNAENSYHHSNENIFKGNMKRRQRIQQAQNYNNYGKASVHDSVESDFFTASASRNSSNKKPFAEPNAETDNVAKLPNIQQIRKAILQIKGTRLEEEEDAEPVQKKQKVLGAYQEDEQKYESGTTY